MNKSVVVVQARMTSTRLPGKVLMDLNGKTVLNHVLSRCKRIRNVEDVWCAIPSGEEHDPVSEEALLARVKVHRGSETDVLSRYAAVARESSATSVIRVTSDCPLICPDVCSEVLGLFHESGADYACNNMPPSWPHGLDCEVFSSGALFAAEQSAADNFSREHVTPWIRANTLLRRVNYACEQKGLSSLRLTLDYPEDYRMLSELFRKLGNSADKAELSEILSALDKYPEIIDLNVDCIDKNRINSK
ncbi:cytidylyltransferase domain-containing protein [Thalassospira povalilytica]|uniref:Glycosyltransferase family protein n=1 Tax=Thalassospira povalilytica TaxID=732237 RepID=A0A8I1M658_9PROT|nr:glycosyltransferase family protein [Thalassospira povalilytica]MBN8195902.1 glycosyltransferase family protein [Thalassospira povalilytica]